MFELGAYNAICDRCARKVKNHELRKEWTGLRVCDRCHEKRHPQENIRSKPEQPAPAWVRPPKDGVDVSPGSGNEVTPEDL